MGLAAGRHKFKFGSDSIVMDVAHDEETIFVSDDQLETLKLFAGRRILQISWVHVFVDGAWRNQIVGDDYNAAAEPEAAARTAKIIPFRRAS